MTDTEAKEIERINAMTYEDMLRKVRFAPAGHRYFRVGSVVADAFTERMRHLRAEVGDAGHTTASKRIGWDQ